MRSTPSPQLLATTFWTAVLLMTAAAVQAVIQGRFGESGGWVLLAALTEVGRGLLDRVEGLQAAVIREAQAKAAVAELFLAKMQQAEGLSFRMEGKAEIAEGTKH